MSAKKMTVAELADYLNLPVETVYKYVRGEKVPAKKNGRQWVFDRDEIDQWIESNTGAVGEDATRRILVVDDEPAVRGVFSIWLESAGYAVDEAENGQRALAQIEDTDFDLVFLDLQMPTMNGVEALCNIRRMASPPDVVIVTAHYNGELMEKILQTGPVHVLKKPVERKQFLDAAAAYVPL